MIPVSRKKPKWRIEVPDAEGLWWLSVADDPTPELYIVTYSKRRGMLRLREYAEEDRNFGWVKHWPKEVDRLWLGPFTIPDQPDHTPPKKKKESHFKDWAVHYWDQDPVINDCYGNRKMHVIRARNQLEAITKATAKVRQDSRWFRLFLAQTVDDMLG